jgi:hypothetical protein
LTYWQRLRSGRTVSRSIVKEYDLYVPIGTTTAAGRRQLQRLKRRLTRRFGGLTYFPHKNEGLWRFGGVTFRDEIVILRVIADDSEKAEAYLRRLKLSLQREWRQKEFLIVARGVHTL